MQHILGKICIKMGISTAHIIALLISTVRQLLELRNNQIIAASSLAEWPHAVIDFFSSVNA